MYMIEYPKYKQWFFSKLTGYWMLNRSKIGVCMVFFCFAFNSGAFLSERSGHRYKLFYMPGASGFEFKTGTLRLKWGVSNNRIEFYVTLQTEHALLWKP